MLDSKALTKIQSIILIAIIVIAAVCSGAAYFLLGGEDQSFETIKIGVLVIWTLQLEDLYGRVLCWLLNI